MPDHGVEHDHGGELAAGEDEVAEGEFLIDFGLDHALVDAFVAAAQQDEGRPRGEPHHFAVIEPPALRGEVDDGAGRAGGATLLLAGMAQGGGERFGPHEHAGAAAVGAVIDAPVGVVGEVARVVQREFVEAALAGATGDAVLGQRSEHG